MILFRIVIAIITVGVPFTLAAQEKESAIVEAVVIEGNRVLSTRDLKLLMFTRASPWYEIFPGVSDRRFVLSVFRSDLARITAHYSDMGYVDAVADTVIDRTRPGFVRVRIRFEEGEPVLVSGVGLEGLPADAEQDSAQIMAALNTRQDRPFTRVGREADLKRISDRMQNNGYAFAEVAAEVSIQGKRANVTFRVRPGPRCRFGQVRIEGNRKVSKGLVLKGLTFRKGDAYRKKDLLNSRLQLSRSEAFRSVSPRHPRYGCSYKPGGRDRRGKGASRAEPETGGGLRYRRAVEGPACMAAPEFSGRRRPAVDR